MLARRGFRRRHWQTPWEFHDELAARNWARMEPVTTITRGFCDAHYGGYALNRERLAAMKRALGVLGGRKKPR